MPDATLDSQIARIRDASRRLVREFGFMQPTLAGTDMSPSAVHALIEIGARESMTARALAETLVLDKSSVSRMVRKLVDAGDIAEGVSDGDKREKPLSLTPQGRATLRRIDDFARHQVATALERMPPEAHRLLAEALDGYARALQACRTAAEGVWPEARDG